MISRLRASRPSAKNVRRERGHGEQVGQVDGGEPQPEEAEGSEQGAAGLEHVLEVQQHVDDDHA